MFVEQDSLRLGSGEERLRGLPFAGELHHVESQSRWLEAVPVIDHDVDALDGVSLGVTGLFNSKRKSFNRSPIKVRLDLRRRFTLEG